MMHGSLNLSSPVLPHTDLRPFELHHPVFSDCLSDNVRTLLEFVALRYAKHEERELIEWISTARILLDGVPTQPGQCLMAGQIVSVIIPDHWEDAADTQWYTVWENAEILAVYKPALLPVSRTTRNLYNTLIQLVRRQTPFYDAHLLHRLDTETDGLILIAKDKAADRKWKKQLDQLIERKLYHAVVSGYPKWLTKVVECELSERVDSEIRSQVYVVGDHPSALYKKRRWSKTAFRVLSRDDNTSLIECELFTGRKHQIRTHLSSLGHPIIGDKIYAHEGSFYLKRLDAALSEHDYEVLQSTHHRLTAVELVIRPDPDSPSIRLRLNQT